MKFFCCILILSCLGVCTYAQRTADGAWIKKQGDDQTVLIINPHYFTVTTFDTKNRKILQSFGGTCIHDENKLEALIDFSTTGIKVNEKILFTLNIGDNALSSNITGRRITYDRMDYDSGVVNGTWIISSKEENGVVQTITSDTETIKILSATRFQWVTINTATGTIINTVCGSYIFDNGLYTEYTDFNSIDITRVGRSTNFRGYLNDNTWTNSGKNINGGIMNEIWTRVP
ncbi:hypothetical protein BH11BAC6_BH11BAC6_13960 [soil metagenome]